MRKPPLFVFAPQHCFRAYDIRGNAARDITPETATAIGYAFCGIIGEYEAASKPHIILAGDCRHSSSALLQALAAGIQAHGGTVRIIGLAPTPALYYAVKYFKADGGIMVTGSHNPVSDNGFKLTDTTTAWHTDSIQRLYLRAKDAAARPASDVIPGSAVSADMLSVDDDFMNAYIARLITTVFPDGADDVFSGKTIIWDPGNGAMCAALPALLTALPGRHIIINGEADGTFPGHHPDPGVPENMRQLTASVKEHQADAGFAFDGDGDRLGVVDGDGVQLIGDVLSYVFARDAVERSPESAPTVLADVKTGASFFAALREAGANAVMWKTGHSLIKEKMRDTGAVFGGEASGHVFFAEQYGFDDALFAALRFMDIMRRRDETAAVLAKALPQGIRTPEWRLDVGDAEKFNLVSALADDFRARGEHFTDIDGVRLDNDDGWLILRVSNTQPAAVVMAEGKNDAALNRLIQSLDEGLIRCGYPLHLRARLKALSRRAPLKTP